MPFDFGSVDSDQFGSGLGGILSGMFTDSSKPYDKAMEEYQRFLNEGKGTQKPFYDAGVGAIGNYQDWLNGQKNPTEFINKIMGDYQESPYARYLQQQAQNAGVNAASASGLTGSTPFLQQAQQNASNISSADMNQWLQNVLGINTQYGQGQKNLVDTGQTSANALTNLYSEMAKNFGDAAYGKEAGKQQNKSNILGGIGNVVGSFIPGL